MAPRVLITGGSGFVGSHVCAALSRGSFAVRAAVRAGRQAPCHDIFTIGDLGAKVDWRPALQGVDVVVHLAARAHVAGRNKNDEQIFMEVNAHGTRALAEAAGSAGVRRFIYISSVKVNGESTAVLPFRASDVVQPRGPYARSKWLGERYIKEVAAQFDMESVIVRPPLVYGPGVKANFLALMRCVHRGMPLPFKGVQNSRSLISVWNLSDFLVYVAGHRDPTAGTWMISDGCDVSTPALVDLMAGAMGRRARMFSMPEWILRAVESMPGLCAPLERLYGSLTVDIGATSQSLGWRPVISVEKGVALTVLAYLRTREA